MRDPSAMQGMIRELPKVSKSATFDVSPPRGVRRQAPTLLATAAPPNPRLDEELAFIEVANALAILESTKPRRSPSPPPSPWVVRSPACVSVPYAPYAPYARHAPTPPRPAENRVVVAAALVATLVGVPVALLAISMIY